MATDAVELFRRLLCSFTRERKQSCGRHDCNKKEKWEDVSDMKKVILGSMMMVAGLISAAVLLAGSMANDWTINGEFSSFWNLSQYGLTPFFYLFLGVAALGLAVAIWGVFEKRN